MSNPTITRCPLNYYGATEIQSESGTSMATPLCAGGAALVWNALCPSVFEPMPGTEPAVRGLRKGAAILHRGVVARRDQ
eukprot:1019671-Rhodomonas_salina.4